MPEQKKEKKTQSTDLIKSIKESESIFKKEVLMHIHNLLVDELSKDSKKNPSNFLENLLNNYYNSIFNLNDALFFAINSLTNYKKSLMTNFSPKAIFNNLSLRMNKEQYTYYNITKLCYSKFKEGEEIMPSQTAVTYIMHKETEGWKKDTPVSILKATLGNYLQAQELFLTEETITNINNYITKDKKPPLPAFENHIEKYKDKFEKSAVSGLLKEYVPIGAEVFALGLPYDSSLINQSIQPGNTIWTTWIKESLNDRKDPKNVLEVQKFYDIIQLQIYIPKKDSKRFLENNDFEIVSILPVPFIGAILLKNLYLYKHNPKKLQKTHHIPELF